jgi:hypothetical protein
MLEFIVLILCFIRLHSLKYEKRKKFVLNSKWRHSNEKPQSKVYFLLSCYFILLSYSFKIRTIVSVESRIGYFIHKTFLN